MNGVRSRLNGTFLSSGRSRYVNEGSRAIDRPSRDVQNSPRTSAGRYLNQDLRMCRARRTRARAQVTGRGYEGVEPHRIDGAVLGETRARSEVTRPPRAQRVRVKPEIARKPAQFGCSGRKNSHVRQAGDSLLDGETPSPRA